jgi:hypothetical protein
MLRDAKVKPPKDISQVEKDLVGLSVGFKVGGDDNKAKRISSLSR